jgi:hypothetical protein
VNKHLSIGSVMRLLGVPRLPLQPFPPVLVLLGTALARQIPFLPLFPFPMRPLLIPSLLSPSLLPPLLLQPLPESSLSGRTLETCVTTIEN